MRKLRQSQGFTVVELFVTLVIMSMFLGMVYVVFTYSGKTKKVALQLDAYHDARMLNFRIGAQLKFSNGVLFPPPAESGQRPPVAHQIVFRDELNRIRVIFLTPKQQLMMLDYDDLRRDRLAGAQILGTGVTSFRARQDDKRVVEYQAMMTINKQPHEIINQIKPANTL